MNNKNIIIAIIVILAVAVGVVVLWQFIVSKTIAVTNFEECIAAGNPAMESYPRQCRHGDKTYVEVIELEKTQDTSTSADDAPPGSIHNLPVPEAVGAVRSKIANELGISEGVVIIMSVYEKEWPDGCLGLSSADEICTQVITPGHEVTVKAQGQNSTYRTNSDGSVIRLED